MHPRIPKKTSTTRLLLLLNAALLAMAIAALSERPVGASTSLAGILATKADAKTAQPEFVPKSNIAAVAHDISPAVVTIGAVREQLRRSNDFFAPYLIRSSEYMPYLGSGSLISESGHIITNVHVIEGAKQVVVTLTDGREFPAEILAADPLQDIALLKIAADNLPTPIQLGDSDEIQIGEDVIALGNPFGPIMQDPRPTVTKGVVSAAHRNFRPDQSKEKVYTDMLQTDAAINPGNSGGPLVDAFGRLVGVNTFIFSASGGSQGIGFAIPVNRVRRMLEEIEKYGQLRTVELDLDGVGVRTARLQGVMLRAIAKGGAAQRAGLAPGDVILKMDDRGVSSPDEVYMLIGSRKIGDRIRVQAWREGKLQDFEYIVRESRGPSRQVGSL